MAMGNGGWSSTPRHKNADKFTPWECSFERDHVPPVSPEADKIFQEARGLQKKLLRPTEQEKAHVVQLYRQAAELGHWKAMNNLANCYLNGWGVEKSYTAAYDIYNAMAVQNIPASVYGKYLFVDRGWVTPYDAKEAARLRHKAADLGFPLAQYELGEYYIYKEQRDKQGVGYHICALAQGYAKSAKAIGDYLVIVEHNYPMGAEYYWRATSLGEAKAAFELWEVFAEGSQKIGPRVTYGFAANPELSRAFDRLYIELEKNPQTRYPNLFTDYPIPDNPLISREQSRKMPSNLKDLYGGKWPDEIFPELAPGYMPPKE